MPLSVSGDETASERLRPYKNPEQCLADFSEWFENRKTDIEARRKYEFTVQIAPHAISQYHYWETHAAWNGSHLWEETKKGGRACRRDQDGKIVWISPGLVFPIIGAISEFVREVKPSKWAIVTPELFRPNDMILRAVQQFRSVDSDPMQMGRSPGVYDALRISPSTIVEVMKDMKSKS